MNKNCTVYSNKKINQTKGKANQIGNHSNQIGNHSIQTKLIKPNDEK